MSSLTFAFSPAHFSPPCSHFAVCPYPMSSAMIPLSFPSLALPHPVSWMWFRLSPWLTGFPCILQSWSCFTSQRTHYSCGVTPHFTFIFTTDSQTDLTSRQICVDTVKLFSSGCKSEKHFNMSLRLSPLVCLSTFCCCPRRGGCLPLNEVGSPGELI